MASACPSAPKRQQASRESRHRDEQASWRAASIFRHRWQLSKWLKGQQRWSYPLPRRFRTNYEPLHPTEPQNVVSVTAVCLMECHSRRIRQDYQPPPAFSLFKNAIVRPFLTMLCNLTGRSEAHIFRRNGFRSDATSRPLMTEAALAETGGRPVDTF